MTTVEIPDGSPFGLRNLPYGVFAAGGAPPRAGIRVGDSVLDLATVLRDEVFAVPSLNPFMAQGPARWAAARTRTGRGRDAEARPGHGPRHFRLCARRNGGGG